MKKPKVFVEKNLLGGKEEDAAPPPPPEGDVWLSYWHQVRISVYLFDYC